MSHFDQTFSCSRCCGPVRIVVSPPLSWVVVLGYWLLELGGLCKECLGTKKAELPANDPSTELRAGAKWSE